MPDAQGLDRRPPSGSFPSGIFTAPAVLDALAAAPADGPVRRWGRRLGVQMLLGLLLLGPLVAWLAYRISARASTSGAETVFGDALAVLVRDVDRELHGGAELLRSCRALYDASERVTREEFTTFTHDARARHPSIVAIAWAPRVPGPTREAHERAAQEEGLVGYRVTTRGPEGSRPPAPPAPEHYPIVFVEPSRGTETMLGFDIASDRVRQVALRRALATTDEAASDPVPILARPGGPSISVLLAVFDHERGEPRPGDLPLGVLMLCVELEPIVLQARNVPRGRAGAWMDVAWTDTSVDGRPKLVFPWTAATPRPEAPFAAEERIEFAGQDYVLRATPTPAFLASHRDESSILVAAVAFLGWELFALALYALARSWRSSGLRRQARTVGLLMRSLSEGILMADRDGRVLLANDAALQLLGVSMADLQARDGVARCPLVSPDGKAPYDVSRWPLARAARGEVVERDELRVRRPHEAHDRLLAVTARPVVDEGNVLQGGAMVLQDVTAERSAEASLRRLSSAVEQTADAVYITDQSGIIQYANAGFRDITGFTAADVVGRLPQLLEGTSRNAPSGYAERWGAALAGETFHGTVVHRRKNGSLFEAEQTITPIRDVAGQVTHAVVVMRDTTQRRRLQEAEIEMGLAAEVQQRLYPQEDPSWEGLEVTGTALPATATCGDYYDFLRLPNGTLLLVVGDVSGHGLGPALVMAETRAYLRALVEAELTVDEILGRINAQLRTDLADGEFVSLLIVGIDPATHRLAHANAGHPPALLFDAAGALRARLDPTGPALGLRDDATFTTAPGPVMGAGDVLVLMTDGVLDAPNLEGDVFDEAGVVATLRACGGEGAGTVMGALHGALDVHTAGRARRDDVTLVVCRALRAPAPAPIEVDDTSGSWSALATGRPAPVPAGRAGPPPTPSAPWTSSPRSP